MGFDETSRNFNIASELIASNSKHIQSLTSVLKLTRQEMAKDEDMKETKNTINTIYQMLIENRARFNTSKPNILSFSSALNVSKNNSDFRILYPDLESKIKKDPPKLLQS